MLGHPETFDLGTILGWSALLQTPVGTSVVVLVPPRVERVAARVTFSGTHKRESFGPPPTRRNIEYAAVTLNPFRGG